MQVGYEYPPEDIVVPEEESVAIRKEDWVDINQAIADAIGPLRPHGWRRATFLLREFGPIATTVAIIVSLLGITIGALYQSWGHVKDETTFRTRTEDRLSAIEKDMASIKTRLEELTPLLRQTTLKQIQEAGELTPTQLRDQLPSLRSLAKTARAENVPIRPETVEAVGKKLLEVGTADAWSTALEFVDYKSFLNASLSVAVNSVIGTGTLTTQYYLNYLPAVGPTRIGITGAVPKEQAAQLRKVGEPDPNASTPLGNDWIVATGGSIIIDNLHLKKVILRDVYVAYNGGPIEMENVYFINCTFAVKQQANGERLVATVLEPSPAVTFNAS